MTHDILRLDHEVGRALQLMRPGDSQPLWRYVYGGKPKPFFHPLRTPAGFTVSLFEPHDHIWHRGLWFTIKFLNGENFWEEVGAAAEYGAQQLVTPPTVAHHADGAVEWVHRSAWQRPHGSGAAAHETRTITYRALETEAYALDWDVVMTFTGETLLDRTPFTTWGGYGGLTLRGNRNWQKTQLLFADGTTSDRPIGHPALWGDLAGVFDGGPAAAGGVALFDHPENPRHPSPWYGATGAGHYLNAAFLFHEPMTVAAGGTLHLRYRALVHDGLWDVKRLQAAYDAYVK